MDYGRRRVGVAVSDPLGITAQPLTTWENLGTGGAVEQACRLVREMDIERIVIGIPLTLKGDKGGMAREVERFVDRVRRKSGISVVLWDERLTSVQAQRVLRETKTKASRNKGKVDLVASVLLLQNYLDYTESMKRHEETRD